MILSRAGQQAINMATQRQLTVVDPIGDSMNFLRNWPLALFVFYLCLIAPAVLSCEAHLDLTNQPTFKLKGKLGEPVNYTQLVYAGDQMSFSTIIFPQKFFFQKFSKSTAEE